MGEKDEADQASGKPLHVKLVIVVVLLLAAIGWMTIFDTVWPK